MTRTIGGPGRWAYVDEHRYEDVKTGEHVVTVERTDHGSGDHDHVVILPDGTRHRVKLRVM